MLFVGAGGEPGVKMDVALHVGNLSQSTTEQELLDLFSQVGDVTSLKIMKNRASGKSEGYGFLTMGSQTEADKAVSRFNAYAFADHTLKVKLTSPRVQSGLSSRAF